MTPKSTTIAFILWLPGLVGLGGLHRFYLGYFGTGLLWLCTFGLLGVGTVFDLFRLGSMVRMTNLYRMAGAGGATASATAAVNNAHTIAPVFNISMPAHPTGAMPVTQPTSAPQT